MKIRSMQVLALSLILLLGVNAMVLATTVKQTGGPLTQVRTASSDEAVSTAEREWSLIPDAALVVQVPEGEEAVFIVTFAASSRCFDDEAGATPWCFVRVVIDGDVVAPGQLRFDSAGAGSSIYAWDANSMTFTSAPLAAGAHSVRVHWRVDEGNASFLLEDRTLTVLRARV